jgi:hypothetical protein
MSVNMVIEQPVITKYLPPFSKSATSSATRHGLRAGDVQKALMAYDQRWWRKTSTNVNSNQPLVTDAVEL